MYKYLLPLALVTLAVGPLAPQPAYALQECGTMLMPAAQLKQFARGFTGYHSGVDLTAPYGSPVRAAAAGTVIFTGSYFGYGNMIDIRHPDGAITRYAHLSAYARGIRPGTQVNTGTVIGAVGTSGHAHGAHLHFEIRLAGHPVNPAPYLSLGIGQAACPTTPTPDRLEEAHAPDSKRADR